MLFIVATPIGNLKDITLRALDVLKSVDVILAEDTQTSRKLLHHYSIENKKILSYHQHSTDKQTEKILNIIKEKNVALITDAGTPGISDPGNKLVAQVIEKTDIEIVPIPGPSAVITALSISGFPTDKFIFKGFVPHKKGRQKFLQEVFQNSLTTAFYESPHRTIKTLDQLIQLEKENKKSLQICLCRELTKKFESIYRGNPAQVLKKLQAEFPNEKPKGEFVFLVL